MASMRTLTAVLKLTTHNNVRCGRFVRSTFLTNPSICIQMQINPQLAKWCPITTSTFPLMQSLTGVDNAKEVPELLADFEVSHEDFKFVEDVLPSPTVPDIPEHESYPTPSGWVPPNDEIRSLQKYLVRRTKNHVLPVYAEVKRKAFRIQHLVTLRKIEGDIWALEAELRAYLEELTGEKEIKTQVHEVGRFIRVRGLHAPAIADFLLKRGM